MKKEIKVRYYILGFFLVLFTVFSLRHFIIGGEFAASVDALCPFGGFETLYTLLATGGYVPRILISSLILAIGVLITVVIYRRGFCGYICPFGTIQEILSKITNKKIKINQKQDRFAKLIKYLILIAIILGTAITGVLVFREYDPFATFFHFGKGILWDYSEDEFSSSIIGFIITIIVLIISIFITRFWCRYLCPLGATMNIFNWFGFTKINRNNKCIDCKLCDQSCPMKIQISTVDTIKDIDCINCNTCVNICPTKALDISIKNKTISSNKYAFLVIFTFMIIVAGAQALNIWQSIPTTSLSSNNGTINADLIKGWMTLETISIEANIPLNKIISDLNLPQGINITKPMKDLKEDIPEFETEIVREYVRNYNYQSIAKNDFTCPWGLVHDTYPGQCGLYTDQDKNYVCDYSE